MATIRIVAEVHAEKAEVDFVIRQALESWRDRDGIRGSRDAGLATDILRNLRVIRID